MKNTSVKIVDALQPLFDETCNIQDLKELLEIACNQLNLVIWQDLAGFLIHIDRTNSESLDSDIRKSFANINPQGKDDDPVAYLLLFLRMENAIRLLQLPEYAKECPGKLSTNDATLWALTTFWHKTCRNEIEHVAKRHFGI